MTAPQYYSEPGETPSLDDCLLFLAEQGGTLEFARDRLGGPSCTVTGSGYFTTALAADAATLCAAQLRPAIHALMLAIDPWRKVPKC